MQEILLGLLLLICAIAAFFGMVRYAPTQTSALPVQRVRASILALLQRRPGSCITDICRETKISWGTAQHHLYLLARAGLTTSVVLGRARMFFPPEINERVRGVAAVLQNSAVRKLGEQIARNPGMFQKELCERLGLTRKVFRHQLNVLAAAGLVSETKGPKACRYRPTETLLGYLQVAGPPPSLEAANGAEVNRLPATNWPAAMPDGAPSAGQR